MNRKKWTISEKVLFLTPLLFVGVGATMFLPDGSRLFPAILEILGIMTRESGHLRSCQGNQRMISLSFRQYLQDYDEQLPPTTNYGPEFGWADILQPYLKSTQFFHCPQNLGLPGVNPASVGYTDYFYNSNCWHHFSSEFNSTALTVWLGEGTPADARYVKTQLPTPWLNDPKSPAHRHFLPKSTTLSGANYAFADGHVKWLQPQQIGTAPTSNGGYTFSIR